MLMTRWRKWMGTAALVAGAAGLSGCTRPLYMTPETQYLASTVALPGNLENDPNATAIPSTADHKAPPTIHDSNREPRYMSLQEALAIALEQGTRGNDSAFLLQGQQFGNLSLATAYNDDLARYAGRQTSGTDAIRAFALDPAIRSAELEQALAMFDARFTGSLAWQKKDQAVANIFNNFNNGDFAAFSAGIVKPLATGGVANITFETNYTKLSNVPSGFSVINPSYTPTLTVGFEQPLLRDYGVDINQLLPQHPGSTQVQTYRPTGGGVAGEGILISRLRVDQEKLEFERNVNAIVFNVELSYWSLYGRYYAKYAAEQALRQGYVTWEQLQQLQAAGLQTKQGVAQARAQFERFRLQYLAAIQNVLDGERRFRGILGMPLEDGKRIVPSDTPILAPYKPDYSASLVEAMTNRPEVRASRQQLKIQQLNVMVKENNVRPDLRFFANYSINGIGPRLDGPGPVSNIDASGNETVTPGNAISNFADNKFGSWNIGARFDVPFGNREAHAALKVAQLNLAKSHIELKTQERKIESSLGSAYQQLDAYYEQIQLQQAQRVALGTQLQGQFERVKIGKDPLIQLLDAQQAFATSIQQEAEAVASYNIVLAAYQVAKGTILQYNNITINDGPLPTAIAERAADHFAARQAGLKLRERPAVSPTAPATLGPIMAATALPEATGTPKVDPDAPPPMPGVPVAPMVIPPTVPAGPKDAPKDAPKDTKPKDPKTIPLATPGPLPSLTIPVAANPGPTLPAASTNADEMPAMPSTPVSKFRPK
ncbi:MAG TPA: TolC family protein [Gemmataceae bacterium]|jgi:outer membrane protein TolC|nr:TolC family protein [Gemmataceae bacterium]